MIIPSWSKTTNLDSLLPTVKMASRQRLPQDDPQHVGAGEEVVDATGEGDEVMEDAEEQDDGYSE